MVDMLGTIPWKHFGRIGLFVAFHDPHLFSAPFFRSLAEFGRDSLWIDELLSEARGGENDRRNENQVP